MNTKTAFIIAAVFGVLFVLWSHLSDRVRRAWKTLNNSVAAMVKPAGFTFEKETYNRSSFGSRFATFVRGPEAFRIVWDGKDMSFFIQFTDNRHATWPHEVWRDIACVRFKPDRSDTPVNRTPWSPPMENALANLLTATKDFLASLP